MSDVNWFELPTYEFRTGEHVSAEIRAWMPGDGLACRGAKQGSRIPCGVPAAVVKQTTRSNGYRPTKTTRTHNYCARHAADYVKKQMQGERYAPGMVGDIVKVSQETILAKYWDEYQELVKAETARQKADGLSQLPDWLRAEIETLDLAAG